MFTLNSEETRLIDEIRNQGQMTLPELGRVLKVQRSTLYYQLQSLVKKGVLEEMKLSPRRTVYRLATTEQLQQMIVDQRRDLERLLLAPRSVVTGRKPKLVFCDWYTLPDELLKSLAGYEVVTYPDSPVRISPEAFVLRCSEAEVAVTFFSVKITRPMLVACPRLQCLVTASVSTEMIDMDACQELGIEVRTLRQHNYYKQAARTEFVFASLFNVLRPVYPAAEALRLGQFDYRGFVAEELRGKTVGVVGVKREGREIIPVLRAFGCGVAVCDPDDVGVAPSDVGVAQFESLERLFADCDVIIFPEEYGRVIDLGPRLMNARMKARYFLFLSYSLKLHLDVIRELIISKHLTALALDYFSDVVGVYHDFPHSKYRQIMNFPNVVITPELGFYTTQSMARNNQEVAAILQEVATKVGAR